MDLLAVHYHDAVQGFTLENILSAISKSFVAIDLFKNKIENSVLLVRSISSIRLLASAQGNEMEHYAFRQDVSRAYVVWRVLWART
jgi:hypothetical protein